MTKFKVGDRVRIKPGCGYEPFYSDGAEGHIDSIYNDDVAVVTFDRGCYDADDGGAWAASNYRLELCPAETPKKPPRRYVVNAYNDVVDKVKCHVVASCPTRAIARTIANLLNAQETSK